MAPKKTTTGNNYTAPRLMDQRLSLLSSVHYWLRCRRIHKRRSKPRSMPWARYEEYEEDDDHRRVHHTDHFGRGADRDNRWENGFKVDIPEFHGGIRGDDLLAWIISVEEVLDFKQVLDNRRVPLVAMRFRGHAASWWNQLKSTRTRTGKEPIQSWERLKKHLRKTFLPHNYDRTMYTRLQNLKQGNRSVDEYAEEFSQLLTRNELYDSQLQLVARFIGGLRPQQQNAMAQFDPTSVSEAHRRAGTFEQQFRSSWNSSTARSRTSDLPGASPTIPSRDSLDQTGPGQKTSSNVDETQLRRSTQPNALRCFGCGEAGHRQTACPNQPKRGLLLEEEIDDQPPVFDDAEDHDEPELNILMTTGDKGTLLFLDDLNVLPSSQWINSFGEDIDANLALDFPQESLSSSLILRRSSGSPPDHDNQWLRTNIFRSSCTIKAKICSIVIDSGSSRNVIAADAVQKLGISAEAHPVPYSLSWVQNGCSLRVTHRAMVPFSIGAHYCDEFYFDIVPMDVSHLILGRPWEYDPKMTKSVLTFTNANTLT
ncbi:unnamed protein product [Microthlaspi erraticum]|uniref:CCHC-type domain-containing protein n=1 Tax=Microthlaspi erraticum TaxID=1685480 RepID=A0A6D2L0R7_9BRAS|nr:unnamed protein product [Microthlaspi erraticum]